MSQREDKCCGVISNCLSKLLAHCGVDRLVAYNREAVCLLDKQHFKSHDQSIEQKTALFCSSLHQA